MGRACAAGGAALRADGMLARFPASRSLADAFAADAAEPHALYFVHISDAAWEARFNAVSRPNDDDDEFERQLLALPPNLAHSFVVARAGDAGALLQSYAGQYTLTEWLAHPRRLTRSAAITRPSDPRIALRERPAHRGVLSRAQLAEACAAIDRVCAAPWDAAAAADYEALTGVSLSADAVAEVQRAQPRLQLTWLRTLLELPAP